MRYFFKYGYYVLYKLSKEGSVWSPEVSIPTVFTVTNILYYFAILELFSIYFDIVINEVLLYMIPTLIGVIYFFWVFFKGHYKRIINEFEYKEPKGFLTVLVWCYICGSIISFIIINNINIDIKYHLNP